MATLGVILLRLHHHTRLRKHRTTLEKCTSTLSSPAWRPLRPSALPFLKLPLSPAAHHRPTPRPALRLLRRRHRTLPLARWLRLHRLIRLRALLRQSARLVHTRAPPRSSASPPLALVQRPLPPPQPRHILVRHWVTSPPTAGPTARPMVLWSATPLLTFR